MTTWPQQRPPWCPHTDCAYLRSSQAAVCVGKLPEPRDHGGVPNTHRFCMHGAPDDGEWTHTMEVNRGDSWHLRRVLQAVMEDAA